MKTFDIIATEDGFNIITLGGGKLYLNGNELANTNSVDSKANLDANNLTDENIESWRDKLYSAGNGIDIKDGVITSVIPYFADTFFYTYDRSVSGTSSNTATLILKTYAITLPKGRYLSFISGVIKTSQFTCDLYAEIDGAYSGIASTNLTSYVGCSGVGTYNLEDGEHIINITLGTRGTGIIPSYNRINYFLIRVGD